MKKTKMQCSIDTCDKDSYARNWCKMHYQRWSKHGDPLKTRYAPAIERYEENIDRLTTPLGCHVWTGTDDGHGYGHFYIDGQMVKAHRFGYSTYVGAIPSGLCVLHHCDNPPCQKPEHWFLGTRGDNIADRNSKGRANMPKGEDHCKAKLTTANVIEIRQRFAIGNITQKVLAEEFGVSDHAISSIILRKAWTGV